MNVMNILFIQTFVPMGWVYSKIVGTLPNVKTFRAHDYKSALAHLVDNTMDLIITDAEYDTRYTAMDIIRLIENDTRVIVLVGKLDDHMRKAFEKQEVREKPLTFQGMKNIIKDMQNE